MMRKLVSKQLRKLFVAGTMLLALGVSSCSEGEKKEEAPAEQKMDEGNTAPIKPAPKTETMQRDSGSTDVKMDTGNTAPIKPAPAP